MTKVLPGYETLLLIPTVEIGGVPWMVTTGGKLVDYEHPTSALLNGWLAITDPTQANGKHGGNISCAVLDDLNVALDDSDTDDTKTVCSKGNSSELTFYNFTVELNARRDADVSAASVSNLFRELTRSADVPYMLAHRVRGQKNSTVATAIGEEWDFYYIHTDFPTIQFSDNEPLGISQSFVPKNVVNVKYALTA